MFFRIASLLLLSASCFAQTPHQKYIPLQAGSKPGSPAPASCVATYKIISPLVMQYPHPDSWTWVMACDDRTWAGLLQHLGQESAGQYIYALTDQENHITYIRAEGILHPTQGPDSAPEHVIAHELVHIFLHSSDERRVEDKALDWLKANRIRLASEVGQ